MTGAAIAAHRAVDAKQPDFELPAAFGLAFEQDCKIARKFEYRSLDILAP